MPFFSSELWSSADTERYPALGQLFQATRGCTSETFWDFAQTFNSFLHSDFIPTFIADETLKIASTSNYGDIQSDEEVEIIRGQGFRISMGKIKAVSSLGSDYSEVICYASDFIYINLGPSPLEIEFFEFPSDRNNNYFETSVRPLFISRYSQAVGDIVKARAGVDVLRIAPPTCDTFQIYVVSLVPRMSLLWHFDAVTMLSKYCTAANLMSSRVQMAIDILVRMGAKRALPEIIGAAKSKDHFVRWAAIAAAACLDNKAGLQLLQKALEDPHPDIRFAALHALSELK
jgi:hypothetical protein